MSDAVKRVDDSMLKMANVCGVDLVTWNDHCDAIRAIIEENKRLRDAIKKATTKMHVDCDTGFLCLSDLEFGELKNSLEIRNEHD